VAAGCVGAEEGEGLRLEELVPAELERALHEVAREGGSEARREGARAFVREDRAEGAEHAAVVGCGVELDAGFDARGDVRWVGGGGGGRVG
jgi:xanthine/CO dehydrogenase XdhC/CoxF family maturation factor